MPPGGVEPPRLRLEGGAPSRRRGRRRAGELNPRFAILQTAFFTGRARRDLWCLLPLGPSMASFTGFVGWT